MPLYGSTAEAVPLPNLPDPILSFPTQDPAANHVANPHQIPPEPNRAKSFAARHRRNLQLAARLDAADRPNEAAALEDCTVTEGLWFCSACGATMYHVNHCKLRFCAFCAQQGARERAKRIRRLVKFMDEPKWLTLTMERSPDLADGINCIRKAFARWRRRKQIAALIKGGIYKIEAKLKDDGWHVHLHAIVDAHYIPIKLIWATWANVLGQPHACANIGRVQGDPHIRDLAKYAAKFEDIEEWPTDRLLEWIDAWKNTRMLQPFGNVFAAERLDPLEEQPAQPRSCPNCGHQKCLWPIRAGPGVYGQDWDQVRHFFPEGQPDTRPREAVQHLLTNVAIQPQLPNPF